MDTELTPSMVWLRKSSEVKWLAWSLEEARRRSRSDEQLLTGLQRGVPKPERESVLKEIERRLLEDRPLFHEQATVALKALNERNHRPGPPAQGTDRLLRRLLWRLSSESARALALSCAGSRRLQRRIAAWRFYATHGLDEDARVVIVGWARREFHEHLEKLVIHDSELIEAVGLEEILARVTDPYWRGRALETCLAVGDVFPRLLRAHPSEALFAIRRAERIDLLRLAHRLFTDNRSDPRVVSAAIQLFGSLDATPELREAAQAGLEIIEVIPEPERGWMGLDHTVERLQSDPLAGEGDRLDAGEIGAPGDPHPQSALW